MSDCSNKNECTCTYLSCSHHGRCCDCIKYHRERDELPGCYFPPEIEKTYDRSIKNFIKWYQSSRL
ncbi:MAG: DUF6485 family protein [Promethearchaeota archaeon]